MLLLIDEPYNSDIVLQILLVAKTSPNKGIRYSYMSPISVKKLITGRKSAGIRNKSYLEVPQRLNAGDLNYAYLVGLVEGDG